MREFFTKFTMMALLVSSGVGCARAPLTRLEDATRKASTPALSDDLPLEPLVSALGEQILFLENLQSPATFVFGEGGERIIARVDYLSGLKRFKELLEARLSGRISNVGMFEAIEEEFEFYEVYGNGKWGNTFITSYYEPQIRGSLRKKGKFTQPLYRVPADMIDLDLSRFDSRYEKDRKLRARVSGQELLPYFSREEIDSQYALKNRGLEICWVDPIDAFFLQIQGSGTVELENGKSLKLNYAQKNGHPYEPLGKFLRDSIPPEKMSLQTIEQALRTMPEEQAKALLNKNPSYVFFQTSGKNSLTYLGLPATDGRTIATDPRHFQKGTLAFLQFERPVFSDPGAIFPDRTEPVSRFVLDQDIGGAITGGGRVDLFWGRGAEAKRHAGVLKSPGRLYYLVPKAK